MPLCNKVPAFINWASRARTVSLTYGCVPDVKRDTEAQKNTPGSRGLPAQGDPRAQGSRDPRPGWLFAACEPFRFQPRYFSTSPRNRSGSGSALSPSRGLLLSPSLLCRGREGRTAPHRHAMRLPLGAGLKATMGWGERGSFL